MTTTKTTIKLKWHTEKRKVDDLILYEENPREMTEIQKDRILKSLREFDLVEIPAINTNNIVCAGNQRTLLLKLEGRGNEEVDVRVPNRKMTDSEFRRYNIKSNKLEAGWNNDMLANIPEPELLEGGFESEELDEIFGLGTTDDFDPKKELEKAVKDPKGVKVGDLWELGDHRLIVGNSTDRKVWEKLLGEERYDFMFTDPPYKIAYGKNRIRKVKTKDGYKLKGRRKYESVGDTDGQGKSLKSPKGFGYKGNRIYEGVETTGGVPEFDEWLSIANDFQNKKGANVMIFEYWKNMVELWQAVEKYWKVKNMIIWHLPNRHQGFAARGQFFGKYDVAPLAGEGIMNCEYEKEFDEYLKGSGQKLMDTYEIIAFGTKGKAEWGKKKGGKLWTMSDHITYNAVSESQSGQNVVFGTKPIQILVPYIKTLSQRGGIVMEPFGGSGSTIIASEIMKRKCRTIELSENYAEVIIRRFEKFTGKKAKKL